MYLELVTKKVGTSHLQTQITEGFYWQMNANAIFSEDHHGEKLRSVAVARCCLHHWTLPAHLGMTCLKNVMLHTRPISHQRGWPLLLFFFKEMLYETLSEDSENGRPKALKSKNTAKLKDENNSGYVGLSRSTAYIIQFVQ